MKIAKHLKSVDYSPINDVRIIYQKLSNNILCIHCIKIVQIQNIGYL